jgi:hypothetical protein
MARLIKKAESTVPVADTWEIKMTPKEVASFIAEVRADMKVDSDYMSFGQAYKHLPRLLEIVESMQEEADKSRIAYNNLRRNFDIDGTALRKCHAELSLLKIERDDILEALETMVRLYDRGDYYNDTERDRCWGVHTRVTERKWRQ